MKNIGSLSKTPLHPDVSHVKLVLFTLFLKPFEAPNLTDEGTYPAGTDRPQHHTDVPLCSTSPLLIQTCIASFTTQP
jgi:hypothetical protein